MNKLQLESENADFKAKEQLYAFFYELTSEIKGKEIELDEEQYISNINTIKIPQLIQYLKNTIQILIRRQVDNALSLIPDSHPNSITQSERFQYEKIILHLESREKLHIRKHFEQNGTKEILESKLIEYIEMEKEFEQLKEKVKYEEGRFLKNERKDNEIIIIRSENTILKKAINDLEEKMKVNEREIEQRDIVIEQLKETIEDYRLELDRTKKDLKLFSNININISNSGNNNNNNNNNHSSSNGNINNNNHNNNSNVNQSKCAVCGCHSTKPQQDKVIGEQTQFKIFNLKKVNNQSQNQKSKIQYNLNQLNGSLSNTHITFDLLSNKASASSTGKNITLQHNNSMNLLLDKSKGDFLHKNINSSRLMNNNNINNSIGSSGNNNNKNSNVNAYCMKITKLPINQSRCPIINNNNGSLGSKREQGSKRVVINKNPQSLLINNKSHLNSTVSRAEL